MALALNCPQCGKPLSSDSPQGLCPECLFKAAIQGQSIRDAEATALHDSFTATAIAPEAGGLLKYFGDYELLEEIARGGMGVVWKARQSSLNRDVALKMIRTGVLAGPDEVARFLREAEAAANLQHPNIVAIHEVGEHGGQHYFSMDFVAGRDLGAIVKDGPLLPKRAARYVKIIAEAIHFAHQRGTLHRDLKPQNVLIDDVDQPRITDFGVAKIMKNDSQLTQTGVVMGSPSYMPPEQAAGRHGDIGPASDVYSLGAMLYELLTGRPPFRGATALATMRDVMEAEPIAPRRLLGTIPPDLETICLKCLEKSPTVRYPTARALAEELDRFLKGEPIQARPASAVRKVVSWARRHPRTLATLAALVMIALAFGVFYLVEENAFLRAQQADPALTRTPGPLQESLKLWIIINFFAAGAGVLTNLALRARGRGLSFKERFDAVLNAWPKQPMGERTRSLAIGAGLILVGCGVMLLVTLIQACVWEGFSIFPAIFAICMISCLPIELGLFALVAVIQDYRLVDYGISSTSSESSRLLTEEEIQPIRHALEDDDWIAAVNRYRDAIPNAGFTEASQYVARLRELLRAQHPGKNDAPPLSLAALLKEMLIGTMWPAFFLGCIFWFCMKPASHLTWIISECACGLLIGMGLTAACTRVKSFWKRMLLLVPALVLVTVTEVIRSWLSDPSTLSVWAYLFGSVYGGVQMAFGFKPKPKRTRTMTVILCLGSFVVPGNADEPPKYKPIDPETIAAYKNLGADYHVDAAAKSLPSFHLEPLRDGTLPKLPPVQVPFGLVVGFIDFGLTPNDMGVTDAGLKELKDLKDLTALVIKSAKVTDAGLKELAELKNLTALHLQCRQVTDTGLKELKNLKNLTTLDLGGTPVTDAGLKDLKNLKNLTSLNLGGTQVTDAGLKELKSFKNLTSLMLNNTPVTDEGIKELKELPNLATLDICEMSVTVVGLKELKDLKNLATLGRMPFKMTDAGLVGLKELKNLSAIDLTDTKVTDEGLKELKNLKNLTTLELCGTKVTDSGLKELKDLKNLTYLGLTGTHVTDAGLKELKDLKNLTVLGLSTVTDAGLKELAELKNLTALHLQCRKVTDAGLKELKNLENLTTLDLGGTQVTDAGLKELKNLKNLTTLNLSSTQVTDTGLKVLKEALPKCWIYR